MSRYTEKQYKLDLININKNLALDCSIDYVAYGGRYDMTYSDRVTVKENGLIAHYGAIECGTPKEALQGAYKLVNSATIPNTLTREQCKTIAYIAGIDFNLDFHELSSTHVELLVTLAKKSKYKKPGNANGSTARYFFAHLVKRVDVDLNNYSLNQIGLKG